MPAIHAKGSGECEPWEKASSHSLNGKVDRIDCDGASLDDDFVEIRDGGRVRP